MKSSYKIGIVLFGLLLRAFAYAFYESSWISKSLLVGSSFTNSSSVECLFLHSRNVGYLASSPTWCSQIVAPLVISSFGSLSPKFIAHILNLAAISAQLLATILMYTIEIDASGQSFGMCAALYWLNPVCVVGCFNSPIPFSLHSLIMATLASAIHCNVFYTMVLCSLLCFWSLQFAAILPLLVLIILFPYRAHTPRSLKPLIHLAILSIVPVILLCVRNHESRVAIDFAVQSFQAFLHNQVYSSDLHSLSPSVSLVWYLKTEVFSDYLAYFRHIFYFQPLIFSIPIFLRLKESPYEAVNVFRINIDAFYSLN